MQSHSVPSKGARCLLDLTHHSPAHSPISGHLVTKNFKFLFFCGRNETSNISVWLFGAIQRQAVGTFDAIFIYLMVMQVFFFCLSKVHLFVIRSKPVLCLADVPCWSIFMSTPNQIRSTTPSPASPPFPQPIIHKSHQYVFMSIRSFTPLTKGLNQSIKWQTCPIPTHSHQKITAQPPT